MIKFTCKICGQNMFVKKYSYIALLMYKRDVCSMFCYNKISNFEEIIKESRWVTDNAIFVNKDIEYEV